MADTYNVFEAAHHANLGNKRTFCGRMGSCRQGHLQPPMAVAAAARAPRLALDARYLIVPRDLRLTAMNLLYPSFAHEIQHLLREHAEGSDG
jgi:hypothetical protein